MTYCSGSYPATGWRFTREADSRVDVVVVRRRRGHQRRVPVPERRRRRSRGSRRSRSSTRARRAGSRGRRRRRRRGPDAAPAGARGRRRARRRRDGRRTRRRRRAGPRAGARARSSSSPAPGCPVGATINAKFSAPSALVSTKRRLPAGPSCGSTWYSWPCTRGSTTRAAAAMSSASTSRTSVVTFDADMITRTRPVRARSHRHEESVVVFLVDEHVVVAGRADGVAPHLPGAHRLVGAGVEHGAVVVRPGDAVVHVGHDVGKVVARLQRAEAQVVALTAARVGRVRGEGLCRVDREIADREVLVARRDRVLVEHDRLTRRGSRWRIGVGEHGECCGAPAVHVVLLALDGPREVLEVAAPHRRRHVGLADASHDLRIQPLAERLGVGERRSGVLVLRFEVGEHGGIVAFAQPEPRVDALVVEVAECGGARGRERWTGGIGHPGILAEGSLRVRSTLDRSWSPQPRRSTTPSRHADRDRRRARVGEVQRRRPRRRDRAGGGHQRGAHARLDERRGAAAHARHRAHLVLEPESPGVLVQGRDVGRPAMGA